VTGDTQSAGQRFARQGLTLPDPPAAVAAFAPYVRSGTTMYVSSQINVGEGQLVTKGRLGADVDIAGGQPAARMCVQPQVADDAWRLFLDVLGEAGAFARSAIGVAALPLGHRGLRPGPSPGSAPDRRWYLVITREDIHRACDTIGPYLRRTPVVQLDLAAPVTLDS